LLCMYCGWSDARARALRACVCVLALACLRLRACTCVLALACLRLRVCACVFACLRLRACACVLALACLRLIACACVLALACLRLRACACACVLALACLRACVLAFACLRLRTVACVLALACFQTELQARKGARLGARAPQAQWFRTSLSPCAGLRFRGWRQRLPKRSQQRTRDPSTSSARQHRKYFLFGRRQRRRRRQNRDAAEPARAKGSRVLAGVQLFADRGRKRLPYRAGDASFPFQGLLKWTEHLRNVNNARAQRRATRRVRA